MLKLQPNPTFKAKVAIGVPGAEPVEVEFTFRYRSKPELDEFIRKSQGMNRMEAAMAVVVGWELTDEFNQENLTLLFDNYYTAEDAVAKKYFQELHQAKEKNSEERHARSTNISRTRLS